MYWEQETLENMYWEQETLENMYWEKVTLENMNWEQGTLEINTVYWEINTAQRGRRELYI